MLDISAPLKIAFKCNFLMGFYERLREYVNTQFALKQFALKEGYP